MGDIIQSQTTNAIVCKFWIPLVCILIAFGVFARSPYSWGALLSVPFLVLAFFGFSLAIVEIHGVSIRYRRLFRWRRLDDAKILDARVEWAPMVGSMQLSKFVFPWGRVYFVLDKNTESNPFRRGEFPILRYLNSEVFRKPGQKSVPPSVIGPVILRLLLGIFLGSLACLMVFYLTPSSLLQPNSFRPGANMPTLLRLQFKVIDWFHRLPVQAAALAVIVFLAVKRRNKSDSWLYGFLSGFGVTAILQRWWS